MSDQYIPPTQEEKDECIKRIQKARTKLIVSKPFFGILATKLIPVENDTWCQTMATDGKHLFYNVRFLSGVQDPKQRKIYEDKIRKAHPDATTEQIEASLNGKTDKELLFIVCHEILHVAYQHFIRLGMREPQRWNRAADYAINQIIHREGIGELPKGVLYDRKFDNMAAEEIYRYLEEHPQEDKGSSIDQHPGAGTGESDGKSRGTAGEIMSGTAGDEYSGLSGQEMEEAMEDFQQTMIQAAQAGQAPAGIERLLAQLTEPKICWRDLLNRTLRSHIKHDQSYMTPNRRSWDMGVVFPGMTPENEVDICVAIDTSGSISNEMCRDFLSEVYGITETFDQFKIHLVCFDTAAHAPEDFDISNVDELLSYEVKGGGGTMFSAFWNHLKDNEIVPDHLVVFTDGYCWSGDCENNGWGPADYCPTLWVIHSSEEVAPFGTTIPYSFD